VCKELAAIKAAKHNKVRFAKIRASICFYNVKNFEVLTSRVFVIFLTKAKEEPKPKSRPLRESKALKELSGAKATVFFSCTGILEDEYLYTLKVNCSWE